MKLENLNLTELSKEESRIVEGGNIFRKIWDGIKCGAEDTWDWIKEHVSFKFGS